jgi:hypothetical protein
VARPFAPPFQHQVIVVMMHPAPHLPLPIFCPCHPDPLLRNALQVNPLNLFSSARRPLAHSHTGFGIFRNMYNTSR